MLEAMVKKMRDSDDEYTHEMMDALEKLDCIRERLIKALEAVDRLEDGMDKAKFEKDDEEKPRKRR